MTLDARRATARSRPWFRKMRGVAAVGLRTAQPPQPGSKRSGGDPEGSESSARQLASEQIVSAPALQPHPRVTYPVPHHPRGLRPWALCRSGDASCLGPEMAAEQRESGLKRELVRLAGGRSPPRERSAAVALATAGDWENLCGGDGPTEGRRRRAAVVSKPALQRPTSGLRSLPAAGLTRSRPLRPALAGASSSLE